MNDTEIKKLSIGDTITATTVDECVKTGVITSFGEHVVIISCGVYHYMIRKSELQEQGYQMPAFKKKVQYSIKNLAKRA